MIELNKVDLETYHLPKEREFSPNDIDSSIRKFGSGVVHAAVEVPTEADAIPIEVRHAISDLDSGTAVDNEKILR